MPTDYTTKEAMQERRAELSRNLVDSFTSNSPAMQKRAEDLTNAFTRKMLMENSFMHKILPAEPLQPSELTEDINERKPYKLVPLEPNSRGACTVQFGSVPNSFYFDVEYYKVPINRIITHRLTMDIMELMRHRYDIRQVLVDKQTKYIEVEKDRRFLDAVNYALLMTETVGALGNGTASPSQMREFSEGLTREALVDASMIMQSTPAHCYPTCALCNIRTYSEFAKWYDYEMGGGSTSEDIITNGMGERNFYNINWISSIKHELLPDGFVYFFSSPDYLGKHYVVEDLQMWVKSEAYMLTTFQWMASGAAIGNVSGLALAVFNPNGLSDGGTPITVAAPTTSVVENA